MSGGAFGGRQGPRGPAGAAGAPGAPGAQGEPGPAGSGGPVAPAWDWLEAGDVEGVDLPFDLGDWESAHDNAGAVADLKTLNPALRKDDKEILLRLEPTGATQVYGAIYRPVALADGAAVCIRLQATPINLTNASTALNFMLNAIGIEGLSAANKWHGGGVRWPAAAMYSNSNTLNSRYNTTSLAGDTTGVDINGLFGALLSPLCVMFLRVGTSLEIWIALNGASWVRQVVVAQGTFDCTLATTYYGIRLSVADTEQRAVVSGWRAFSAAEMAAAAWKPWA